MYSADTSSVSKNAGKAPKRTRNASKSTPPAVTPTELTEPTSPHALSSHIETLAKNINAVLIRNNTVTRGDKEEIQGLVRSIIDATQHITYVMDPQTIVSNINATDLLSSVKEEFAKLREDIKNSIEAPKTYASVTSKQTRVIKTPLYANAASVVVGLKTPNAKSSATMKEIEKTLNATTLGVQILNKRNLSNGKVLVTLTNATEQTKFNNAANQISTLQSQNAKKFRPVILLKGVQKDMTDAEITDAIVEQNSRIKDYITSNNATTEDTVKIRFKALNRRNPDHLMNVGVEVDAKIRREIMETPDKRLALGYQRVHVEDANPLKQCFCCWGFGHTTKDCKNKDKNICPHCAGEHAYANCDKKKDTPCCHNCNTSNARTFGNGVSVDQKPINHNVRSHKCPHVIKMTQRAKEMVDYE